MAQETFMTFKTRLSVLLISTPVLAFVIIGGLMGTGSAATDDDQTMQHLRVFDDVVSLVLNNYVEEVKVDRAMEGALRGLADGLDPDSAYLNVKQVRELEAGAAIPEGDVGIELTRQYYLRVIAARDGSPAAKAGLQTGDYVRAIDGKPTREMSVFEGSRLLRGQPGSKVMLTVIRGNAAEPHEVALVREKASGPVVSSRMLNAETGYVRIAAFRGGVADELRKQVTALTKSGAASLVIDVRRTAEGNYDDGIAAARLFVKSGTLAVKAGREAAGPGETIKAGNGDGEVTVPVSVLISAGTSGAAEIFAAALDGNARAELVGEQTLGRAGLQKLVKLPEARGLWLTYVRYLAPGGEAIHGKGLDPDAAVAEPEVEFGAVPATKDPILDAAIERLKGKKAA
jgi:carboxyl-terminal processing protease